MPFSESVALEVIRGLFTLLAVAIGGGVVGRAIERFKGEQAVSLELRRKQYDALGSLLSALAEVETAFAERHHALSEAVEDAEDGDADADAAHEKFLEAHRKALRAIDASVYVLGAEVTNHAVEIANFFVERAAASPAGSLDELFAELRPLRAPLTALLPPPLPSIARPAAARRARTAT
jgi:hypothetical protein